MPDFTLCEPKEGTGGWRDTRPAHSFTPINSSATELRSLRSGEEVAVKERPEVNLGSSAVAAYLGIGEDKIIPQPLAKKRETNKNKSTPKNMARAKPADVEPTLLELKAHEDIHEIDHTALQPQPSSVTETEDTMDCDLLDFASELTEVDWDTISPPATPPRHSLSSASISTQDTTKRIIRRFPEQIKAGSPIPGLSTEVVLRTSFCVGEALNVGCQAVRHDRHVLLELCARVTSSWREEKSSQQHFILADLTHDHPPFLNATYTS